MLKIFDMEAVVEMSFREKSAWVMLVALALAGAFYGVETIGGSLALGRAAPPRWPLFLPVTALLVIVAAVGKGLAALRDPKGADAPEDERDRAVARRASALSGDVLGFGLVSCLVGYLAGGGGDLLFHTAFAALVLAQLVEDAARIILYRRGG